MGENLEVSPPRVASARHAVEVVALPGGWTWSKRVLAIDYYEKNSDARELKQHLDTVQPETAVISDVQLTVLPVGNAIVRELNYYRKSTRMITEAVVATLMNVICRALLGIRYTDDSDEEIIDGEDGSVGGEGRRLFSMANQPPGIRRDYDLGVISVIPPGSCRKVTDVTAEVDGQVTLLRGSHLVAVDMYKIKTSGVVERPAVGQTQGLTTFPIEQGNHVEAVSSDHARQRSARRGSSAGDLRTYLTEEYKIGPTLIGSKLYHVSQGFDVVMPAIWGWSDSRTNNRTYTRTTTLVKDGGNPIPPAVGRHGRKFALRVYNSAGGFEEADVSANLMNPWFNCYNTDDNFVWLGDQYVRAAEFDRETFVAMFADAKGLSAQAIMTILCRELPRTMTQLNRTLLDMDLVAVDVLDMLMRLPQLGWDGVRYTNTPSYSLVAGLAVRGLLSMVSIPKPDTDSGDTTSLSLRIMNGSAISRELAPYVFIVPVTDRAVVLERPHPRLLKLFRDGPLARGHDDMSRAYRPKMLGIIREGSFPVYTVPIGDAPMVVHLDPFIREFERLTNHSDFISAFVYHPAVAIYKVRQPDGSTLTAIKSSPRVSTTGLRWTEPSSHITLTYNLQMARDALAKDP